MLPYLLECEAKTKAEAEEKSLEILQMQAEEVELELVQNTGGLRRLFKSSPVVLRARPRRKDIRQEAAIRGVVYTFLHKLQVPGDISHISEEDDHFYVDLHSKHPPALIGRHGRTLDAFQFLVNLIVAKWVYKSKRVVLDVSDYRKRRRKTLETVAFKAANKADQSGRPLVLNYLSPYERRIIHLLLEEDARVYTESIGTSVYKRLRVIPKEARKSDRKSDKYLDDEDYDSKEDHDPNEDYDSNEDHDAEGYDSNEDYDSKEDHDPNEDYDSNEDHDPNEDYDSKEDHDPNEDYDSKEDHDAEDHDSKEDYDPKESHTKEDS